MRRVVFERATAEVPAIPVFCAWEPAHCEAAEFGRIHACKSPELWRGGEQVVDTILNAETVEVFRLERREFAENLSDYRAIEGPFPVGETDSRELADAVTAYDSYERGMNVSCIPIMHMRTGFVRAGSTVDVVYCFDCSLLSVFHNEKLAGGGLFLPAEARLVRLAKRLLPNDEAVQGLE